MKPPYKITQNILKCYGEISQAMGTCQSLLLTKPEAKLRKQNRIKTIHSSLAIEGNTLEIDQVTALLGGIKVLAPPKEILEVQNAIVAYQALRDFKPYSIKDFLKAHQILMSGLIKSNGRFRSKQVGIASGAAIRHVAPSYALVPGHMRKLFEYLKNDSDLELIKSCVFHYEMEFIHPFEDGNGRMGRYWQTRILLNVNPIFEYLPIEDVIRTRQKEYYKALNASDCSGESTLFIEFMLEAILTALRDTLDQSKNIQINYESRSALALSQLNGWFDRKEYMLVNKGISSATASRDLKRMLDADQIEAAGEGRMTKYKTRF